MNYWPRHIGPWLTATVTLSMAEEGCYGRLCDWAYKHEQPLPLDSDEIFRITRCHSKDDREITDAMLKRFFVQTDSGWRHERIEREISSARKRTSVNQDKRAEDALRQRNYRARRSALFDQAQALGLNPDALANNEQLITAIVRAGATPCHVTRSVTSDVTVDVTSRDASPASETQNYSLRESRESTRHVTSRVTEAGAACKRMRSMGMASVNPSDPRLHSLLELGVDVEAIAMAAAQAVARGKGFAYALAIAKGTHEEQERDRAEMLKWAPGLAQG